MINNNYSKAYTEVLEMLNHLPKEEYDKIPKEKIDFFESNKDNSYTFSINPNIPLEEQNISIEANSIIVILFRDYFASEIQKEKLKNLLKQNEEKYQEELRIKYNLDNIFNNNNTINSNCNYEIDNDKLPIEVKKEKFLKKLIIFIKSLFKK